MTVTAARDAGLPKSYYAPDFQVEVEGVPVELAVKRDVLEIVVTMDLENLTSVDIKLNNYDDRRFDLKWTDCDTFKIGKQVKVKLGYADRPLISMLRGYITTLTPDFPADGSPTLGVRVVDPMIRLKGSKPPEDDVTYRNVRDSDIAKKIAHRHGLQSHVKDSAPRYKSVVQHNVDDVKFLKDRAKLINYDVFMRTDPKTKEDVLFFVPPGDGASRDPIQTFVLAWGTLRNTDVAPSLIEFKPTIAAANQVKSVTVRGWDVETKKPIVATATPENTADVRGPRGDNGADAATELGGRSGKKEVVVDTAVESTDQALTIAKAILARRAYGYKTAKGKLIGLPELRLNDNVEIHGVGTRFGGLYHVTKVTHTFNDRGYLTEFEARVG